jgi:hypothetical protein
LNGDSELRAKSAFSGARYPILAGGVFMSPQKWVSMKPISYVGLILVLVGIVCPQLFGIEDALIRWIGLLLGIFGLYLMFKGREEHGS